MRIATVRSDGVNGRAWSVWQGSMLTIGRNAGQLRFPEDAFISDPHARCRRLGRRLEIADMNSRNGIFVRVQGRVPVYPGDAFLMGQHLLRLANLPNQRPSRSPGVAVGFGTPCPPAWGRLVLVTVGGFDSNVYDLRDNTVLIGREDGQIVLSEDKFMSRRHAQVHLKVRAGGMGVVLEDLNSANGTYLRVRNQTVLDAGAMFRLGDQLLRFEEGDG